MKMNEFFRDFAFNPVENFPEYQMAPSVICRDGFTMSVQASKAHYCTPRETIVNGPYAAFEIGFPSEVEELLIEYAEESDKPTSTVYGWVPVDVIDAVIEKHGGIDLRAVVKGIVNTAEIAAREKAYAISKQVLKSTLEKME